MAQWFGTDDIGTMTITGAQTLDLASSYVRLGGKSYSTGTLSLDISTVGAGGLDAGSAQANTTYKVYMVLNSSIPALVASLNSISPAGFTVYNQIGIAKTDGSANFLSAQNEDDIATSSATVLTENFGFVVDKNGGGNYSTIQDAINAASDGTKITVLSGTFTETLTVAKKVHLIGQGNSTIIDGTVAFNTGANNSAWHHVKFNGNVTVANGVTGISLLDGYINPSAVLTDNNASPDDSLYLLVEEL